MNRGYRSLLGDREIRTLLAGTFTSFAGDQLARLALSVLVFHRTNSALLTGLTYALTFLPALAGGPLLAGLADRLPPRRVMITADLLRAPLVAALAWPGIPLPVAFALLIVVTVIESPFDAARAALLPDVAGDEYPRALALDRGVQQFAQIVGFAGGGVLLVAMGPAQALLFDSATFLISAGLLRWGLAQRPARTAEERTGNRLLGDGHIGLRAVLGDPAVRRVVLLVWLASAVAVVPEGLAVPLAGQLAVGGLAIGLLLAANPIGNTIAGPLVARIPERRRAMLLTPLALVVAVPLMGVASTSNLWLVLALVLASGMGMTVSLLGRAEFVRDVPSHVRGRAFSIAASGITVFQGVTIGIAGGLADVVSPGAVIAGAGVLGFLGTLLIALTHPHHDSAAAQVLRLPRSRRSLDLNNETSTPETDSVVTNAVS